MSATAHTGRRFTLHELSPEPWRNGAGVTRTLASDSVSPTAPWRWRVSVASIASDTAFSTFAGVDRSSMLIDGGQLQLLDDAGQTQVRLGLFDIGHYPGETALHAQVQGAPLQCLNLMLRRQQANARLSAVRQTCAIAHEGVLLMLALRGGFEVTAAQQAPLQLQPGQGLHTRARPGLVLQPLAPESVLALVEVLPIESKIKL